MKSSRVLVSLFLSVAGLGSLRSQGFINLDFETTVFSRYDFMDLATVPGWGPLGYGPNPEVVPFNNIAMDAAWTSLHGTDSPYVSSIQGSYSLYLQAGSMFWPNHSGQSIGQTGQIPTEARSMSYWSSGVPLEVSFKGQPLSSFLVAQGTNYNVVRADVSDYAGQTGELKFTRPWTWGNWSGGTVLDNIQFSTLEVPEPPDPTGGIAIQLYTGLTITGAVGSVYSIQYITDLAKSNTPAAWQNLDFVQLQTTNFLWMDKSAPPDRQRFYRAKLFDAPTNMVFIPPGTFRMGSPSNEIDRVSEEGPQTTVVLTRGFWMGKYEVTQGEYLSVMGTNPSWFNGVQTNSAYVWPAGDFGTDLRRPVESISAWHGMQYCAELTKRERAAGRIPTNSVYRLPTEAEWEYACRAGTSTRFSYGDDPGYSNLVNYAWCALNSDLRPHPVGEKLPNAWGLYDMHGNVFECCSDWSSRELPGGIVVDPKGPAIGLPPGYVVIRGGWFSHEPSRLRSAYRSDAPHDIASPIFGFRVVLAAN